MKRYILFIIFVCITFHINAEYGKYVISLYTTDNCSTGNSYKYIQSTIEIKETNNRKHIISYDTDKNKETAEINNNFVSIEIINHETSATINSYNTYEAEDNLIKEINITPGVHYLGEKTLKYSPYNSSSTVFFNVKYYVDIQPLEIKASNQLGESIIYDKEICINTTRGFPLNCYKWSYYILNKNGEIIKDSTPIHKAQIEDNNFCIKGSDILTEENFIKGVQEDWSIILTPDRAEEEYIPIKVTSATLSFMLSAPIIEDITFNKPLCSKDSATNIILHLGRELLEGENLNINYVYVDNNKYNYSKAAVFNSINSIKLDNLCEGVWNISYINTTYINSKSDTIPTYSEGSERRFIITITVPEAISISNISNTKTSCIGRSDGMVSCEVNGGTGEKICSLNNYDDKSTYNGRFQDGTFVFTGIPKGSYYLEATDENGCLSEKSDTIKISDPEPLKIEVSDITNLQCFGDSDGVISYATSGGTGNKIVFLKYPNGYVKENDKDSNSFSELSAGTYYLSATDEKGCVTNKDTVFKISEPDSLWLELTTTDATIFGNCNGTLSASFGGGTDSCTIKYLGNEDTYSWPQENIELSKYLCAGESEVTLIDGNNCTTTKKYIINQPDPLSAKVKQVDSIKCFGESTASLIVDSIKGGIPPYSVFWYNDNFSSEDFRIQDLPAEEYKVKVTDSMDAELVLSFTIDQPQRLEIFSTDIKPAFCRGDSTGSISLIAEGGTLPYKFFLEDTLSTSGEYASLPAGTYTARVEDKNNCITEGLFTIETLSTLTAKISAESPKCDYLNDGFIDLSVENGLEPYKITWYTEDKVIKEDIYNPVFPISMLKSSDNKVEEDIFTMTELPAGDYSVIVQDAAGCVEKVDTTLYKPAKLEIELPEKLYLCIDQYYPITLENTRIDSAVWYFKDKEYSKSLKTRLRKEGLYNLDIAYDKYCHEYKTIKVDTINKSIKANFLVAEDIPINDDAHLINITSKEDYDYVEWVYPENDAWVYDEDEHSFQLVFLNEGTYQVGMISHKDKCEASLFKTIKTFTPEKGISIEENSYNITRFSIDKSPNNGTFTSHIELSAKADVILYLYNASTGHIVDTQEVKNNKSYDIPFSVKTLAGEYILLLIVPEWEKSSWIKMVIR
ncbi:MAG: hypothetical protein IKA83_03525 [Paludibacteraceae bacterium]|nr:hypothetical protein [Paludibacteraceae bacterium]